MLFHGKEVVPIAGADLPREVAVPLSLSIFKRPVGMMLGNMVSIGRAKLRMVFDDKGTF